MIKIGEIRYYCGNKKVVILKKIDSRTYLVKRYYHVLPQYEVNTANLWKNKRDEIKRNK